MRDRTWHSSCSVWFKSCTWPQSFTFLGEKEPQKEGENYPNLHVGTVESCHRWCDSPWGWWGLKEAMSKCTACPSLSSPGQQWLGMQSGAIPTRSWRGQGEPGCCRGFIIQSLCAVSLCLLHFNQMFCFCWNWYRHPLKMVPLWKILIFLPKVVLVGHAGKSFCLLAIPPCGRPAAHSW